MTDPNTEPEQSSPESGQLSGVLNQSTEIDLNAFLSEQEQYARDVNAEFEARRAAGKEDEWPQWCDEMAAWNEAVAMAAGDPPE